MEILYQDRRIVVAVKPHGIRSTDEPGGMPELLRNALGEPSGCVRTVHRLDQVVGGVMVLARSVRAASILSEQVRDRRFQKTYLAALHGAPEAERGTLRDFLLRDKAAHVTRTVDPETPGAQEAVLDYQRLASAEGLSLVQIQLHTGRTHQIRVQFASRGLPLAGDCRYGVPDGMERIGLWSYELGFYHPETGAWMEFSREPPAEAPWTLFA